jgi:hypothetical protein
LGDGKTGDFHAVSLDLIATYAPDRRGQDEVWLGGQVSYHFNGFSSPPSPGPIRGGTVSSGVRYNRPKPGGSDRLQRRAPAMTAMRQQWTPGRNRLSLAIAAALTAGDHETMPVVPSEGDPP